MAPGKSVTFEFIETDTTCGNIVDLCGYAICGDSGISGFTGYSGLGLSYFEWKKLQE